LNGDRGLRGAESPKTGSVLLKVRVAMGEEEAATEKARLDDAIARANNKKWWKRALGRTST